MHFVFSDFDILAVIVLLISFIGGLITGFANKAIKLIAVVGAITVTYFFAGTIASAICNIESVSEWIAGFEFGGIIVLVATYVLLFLIVLVTIMLLLKPIGNLLTGGPIRKTVNRFLGGVVGLATGFFVCSIYLLLTYFIAQSSPSVNTWFQEQLGYSDGFNTLSRRILDFAMKAVGLA